MVILDKNFSGTLSRSIEDYPDGVVLVIDKPWRWTSADVVRKVKFAAIRHFGKKNLKVGHAGTLDPLADGVLIMCLGNACKKAQELQATDKEYVASVVFGATTPSYDREKDVDARYPLDGVSEERLRAVLPDFIGEQDQVAPLFSAKQTGGVRSYEIARKMLRSSAEGASDGSCGLAAAGSLDAAARDLLRVGRINISELELLDWSEDVTSPNDPAASGGASSRINVADIPQGLPAAKIRIACSKGTYIRALARDIGEALGSGAFLGSLTRTRSGRFRLPDAASVPQIISLLNP